MELLLIIVLLLRLALNRFFFSYSVRACGWPAVKWRHFAPGLEMGRSERGQPFRLTRLAVTPFATHELSPANQIHDKRTSCDLFITRGQGKEQDEMLNIFQSDSISIVVIHENCSLVVFRERLFLSHVGTTGGAHCLTMVLFLWNKMVPSAEKIPSVVHHTICS